MVVFTPALLLQALKWLSSTYAPAPESLSGATACEVQECADVGTSLLSRGGSAADALVGMAACVGTIASYHSGFGACESLQIAVKPSLQARLLERTLPLGRPELAGLADCRS